jgi:hypothetical protein
MRCRNLLIVVFLTGLGQSASPELPPGPDILTALGRIHATSMRGDLSFLASDLLEGRDTPSRGLDIAAEYIAAQFQIAGLEPIGALQPSAAGDYFQKAQMTVVEPNYANFEMKFSAGGRGAGEFSVRPSDAVLDLNATRDIDIKDAPLLKLDAGGETNVGEASQVAGKVLITEFDPKLRSRRAAGRIRRNGKPLLTILVDPKGLTTRQRPTHGLEDSADSDEPAPARTPRITLTGEAAAGFYAALKPGTSEAFVTAHIDAPIRRQVTLRNVIGILRGSDPALSDTSVMLSAHYDHLGVRQGETGDRIYNGANDDGSGVVSVIEAARALASLKQRPKRSILFVTFFGEEEGLLGSNYYAHHPVWPLEKTIAQLNLEQVGRTDSSEGRQISNASLTGFDYSDLTSYVQRAGESTGIRVYKDARNSDAYFADSDNFSLAEAGVPAETLCVAFDFPDYHAVGDEWQKIDYDNMAKVDRAVALALYMMANSEQPVQWNEADPKTGRYVRAWKRRGLQ